MSKKQSFWLGDEKCRSSNAMNYQFMILINILWGSIHKTGRSIDVNVTSEVVHDPEQSKDLVSCEWIFSAGNLGHSAGMQLCTKKTPVFNVSCEIKLKVIWGWEFRAELFISWKVTKGSIHRQLLLGFVCVFAPFYWKKQKKTPLIRWHPFARKLCNRAGLYFHHAFRPVCKILILLIFWKIQWQARYWLNVIK